MQAKQRGVCSSQNGMEIGHEQTVKFSTGRSGASQGSKWRKGLATSACSPLGTKLMQRGTPSGLGSVILHPHGPSHPSLGHLGASPDPAATATTADGDI
ncbi:MAG: hypothetical protein WDW38_001405 [Sanguina aurantia]